MALISYNWRFTIRRGTTNDIINNNCSGSCVEVFDRCENIPLALFVFYACFGLKMCDQARQLLAVSLLGIAVAYLKMIVNGSSFLASLRSVISCECMVGNYSHNVF